MKNESYQFTGIYKDIFISYLNYKRSLGFTYDISTIRELEKLNLYLNRFCQDEIILTEEMTRGYVETKRNLSSKSIHSCECRVRQLGIFLKQMGYKNIYVYPENHVKVITDFVPYVFSREEIKKIFEATNSIKSIKNNSTKLFYQTLLRLLYATGMRISEALSLKIHDINLNKGIITVHAGKGHVSRLIPVSSSMLQWLKAYYSQYGKYHKEYFFESPAGAKRNRSPVGYYFQKKILTVAGIPRKPDNTGPRLHDLRHTFACHCLDRMIADGKDPYCALPYLSTYLGHKGIESTEKYLHLTEEHFKKLTDASHHIYEESFGDRHEK